MLVMGTHHDNGAANIDWRKATENEVVVAGLHGV
jgi:hypothetical protein